MNTSDKTPHVVSSKSYRTVAINCAAKTGEWIKSKWGQYISLNIKSSTHDLVTEIDKGAEQMIRRLLLTHFPQHAILGEESVAVGQDATKRALEQALQEEYVWIIDPLDGTMNYVHGFPFYSVSIALARKGEVIVGIVYDPMRDELFVAEKGNGAYVHGHRMKVASEKHLAAGLLASGFPTERKRALPANLAGIIALAPQVRNIRTAGSAALHMAYVAVGRLTGFWELNLNVWDLAAGSLLIAESGGKVTDTYGQPYHLGVNDVVASNGYIHNSLVHALKEANAQG